MSNRYEIRWMNEAEASAIKAKAAAEDAENSRNIAASSANLSEAAYNNIERLYEDVYADVNTAVSQARTELNTILDDAQTKINAMAEQQSDIAAAIAEYLANEEAVIDTTLLLPGVPSDSKSVGDALEKRDAIISYATENEEITFISGYRVRNDGTTVDISSPSANAGFKLAIVPCSPGDEFFVWGAGVSNYRLYSFSNSSGTVLEVAGHFAVADGLRIVAPATAAYLVVNCNIASSATIRAVKGDSTIKAAKRADGRSAELVNAKSNYPARRLTGDVVCIKSAAKIPLSRFEIPLACSQSGSGDPTPSNPRTIVEPTASVTVYLSDGTDFATSTAAAESAADAFSFDFSHIPEKIGYGTFDAANGKLTIDYGIYTITDETPINVSMSQNRFYFCLPTKKAENGLNDDKCVCDVAKKGTTNANVPVDAPLTITFGTDSLGQYIFINGFKSVSGAVDQAGLTAWLAEHPITFTYPLKEPIVYYFDHEDIIPRFTTNYLWNSLHDTGIENTIEYMPDEKHVYDTFSGSLRWGWYSYSNNGEWSITYTKMTPDTPALSGKGRRIEIAYPYSAFVTEWDALGGASGFALSLAMYIAPDTTYHFAFNSNASDAPSFPHPSNDATMATKFWYQLRAVKLFNENVTLYSEDYTEIMQRIYTGKNATLGAFPTIGACGDSYTIGSIHRANNPDRSDVNQNLAWGKVLGRRIGSEVTLFAHGGADVVQWFGGNGYPENPSYEYPVLPDLLAADPCNLYILCFGINDNTHINYDPSNEKYLPLGTIADIDSNSANYGVTFYGAYSKIIDQIQAHAPNAKIVLLSVFRPAERYRMDARIEAVAAAKGLPFIDLKKDNFFISREYVNELWGNGLHPTAVCYSGMAVSIERMIAYNMATDVQGYWLNYHG